MRTSESLGVTVNAKIFCPSPKGQSSAVDPGFPVGGRRPVRGADLRLGAFPQRDPNSFVLPTFPPVDPATPPGSATGHGTQVFQTTLHSNYRPVKRFASKLKDFLWKSNLR